MFYGMCMEEHTCEAKLRDIKKTYTGGDLVDDVEPERAHTHKGKFQLLPPAPPYYPFPRGKIHTRGNM